MEQREEHLEEMTWEEYDKRESSAGKYLKVELDKPYEITVKSDRLVKDPTYKDKKGNPKVKLILELGSVNGQPTDKTFETGSYTVINEIRKAKLDKSLLRSVFLLKRKQEQDKTKYVFEKLREVAGPSPASYGDEAFI